MMIDEDDDDDIFSSCSDVHGDVSDETD